jgi:hypothetical protein
MENIARVLRAAAYLNSSTSSEIAVAAGIRDSRVARILTGRTVPRGDEPARILRACGIDPVLLTSRYRIRHVEEHLVEVTTSPETSADRVRGDEWGELVPSEALLVLLLRRDRPWSGIMAAGCSLHVDKLSVTFNVTDEEVFLLLAAEIGSPFESKNYEVSFSGHGITVQHRPTHRCRSSRLEFNPRLLFSKESRAGAGTRSRVLPLLAQAVGSTIRVSRIDVAVDLPISIHDVQALGTNRHKLNWWIGKHGLETTYVGGRGSSWEARIYDKRQELIDTRRADEAHPPLLRIEVTVRSPKLALANLGHLANPFDRLRLFHLRSDGLPFARRVMVDYARVFGLPALKAELTEVEFKALAADVEASAAAPTVPHPREVFAARWSSVARRLLHALAPSSEGGR